MKATKEVLDKKIIFVSGPTASGKSQWALQQALKYQGVIVNCDSVQLYREVNIGSSKPSENDRRIVPHYLYDYVSFPTEMTAGQFSRDFFELIPTLKESVIFVVGGTGFYFQAIEQGMYPVKPVKDEVKSKVQEDILKLGFLKIYDWLKERDPEYVVKISANDHYRIERAYELMISEGRSVTDIQREFQAQAKKFPYPLLKVGITGDKEFLLKKVAHRTEKMLHQGLIEEVKSLLTQGYSSWAPLSSVGYREVVEFLEQGRDLDWLSEEIVKNTMKLIKKQKTWFQRDKAIKQINNWSPSEESDIEKNILAELDSFVRCSG